MRDQTVSPVTGLTTHQALEQENRRFLLTRRHLTGRSRLKRENEILRQEREILKLATKFFLLAR